MRIETRRWSARREGFPPARSGFTPARTEISGVPDRGRGSSAAEGRRFKLKKRIFIIAAGGTGGHLFPGIAVADELRRRDPATRVVFAGTPKGFESRLVPRAGHELVLLPILPLNGVGVARALEELLVLPWGLLRAAALVRRLRPAAVLGVGGYAGGPVVLAAALMGVPTVILEPNAKPGFTNRLLRPFVDRAACACDEAR